MAAHPRDLVFVSYSHEDKKWLSDLLTFLKPYQRKGLQVWADPYIEVGERWERKIDHAIARACVGVLLVSQDFLASDFIHEKELPPLKTAADDDELTLVCVPLSSFTFDVSELGDYQWPRDPKKPLAAAFGNKRKTALVEITNAIVGAAKKCVASETISPVKASVRRPAAHPDVAADAPLARLNGVPDQRPNHVPRNGVLADVRALMLEDQHQAVGITAIREASAARLGVQGRGGIGKTVVAIDAVNDAAIRHAFPDGVYWVTLGQSPAMEKLQSDLLFKVTGRRQALDDLAQGRALLSEALAEQARRSCNWTC